MMPNRPGCSVCADRTRPRTAAPARHPLPVTNTSFSGRSSAIHSCSRANACATSACVAGDDLVFGDDVLHHDVRGGFGGQVDLGPVHLEQRVAVRSC